MTPTNDQSNADLTVSVRMNYDTKNLRKKRGISLDLPVGYRNIWLARKSSIIQMIEHGISQIEIANHYECTPTALASAMTYHQIRALNIRHSFKVGLVA